MCSFEVTQYEELIYKWLGGASGSWGSGRDG